MSQELPDLHDSERIQVEAILADLNETYMTRPATKGNLESMVHEAEDRFGAIGLKITLFPGKRLMREAKIPYSDPDNLLPEDFTFTIDGRLDEFDPERQAHEVKAGVADEYWDRRRTTKGGSTGEVGPEHEHKH